MPLPSKSRTQIFFIRPSKDSDFFTRRFGPKESLDYIRLLGLFFEDLRTLGDVGSEDSGLEILGCMASHLGYNLGFRV